LNNYNLSLSITSKLHIGRQTVNHNALHLCPVLKKLKSNTSPSGFSIRLINRTTPKLGHIISLPSLHIHNTVLCLLNTCLVNNQMNHEAVEIVAGRGVISGNLQQVEVRLCGLYVDPREKNRS
jgi:hypothetical protein